MSTHPQTPREDAVARTGTPVVAVCALTCRRPVGVRMLLEGIAAQRFDGPAPDVRVVIVDNDAEGSGRDAVEGVRDEGFPFPLHYAVETTRGIPFGRNRAIAEAGDVDLVVFIDDDEIPEPDWLDRLLRTWRATGADVVTGPVLPVFPTPPPEWVTRGRFFDRRRHRTGEEIHYARTSNVLIARDVYAAHPKPFPESFANNGGDDTYFFMRANLEGRRIVWADDAIVSEEVPASRVDTRWLMRREYRRGNTLSLCLRVLEDSPRRRVKRAAAGVVNILLGAVSVPLGLLRGRHAAVAGLQRVWFGAGLLSGLTGHVYQEYTTIHGR
ncbi:MAG: glycosyltransferase family 2 protein [Thermoleophilia bacterium]